MKRILTINPGSTSTKIAVFDDEKMVFKESLTHETERLAKFNDISEQLPYRTSMVIEALNKNNIPLEIFEKNIQEFSKETAILEKFNPKEKFTEITYEQFGNDVINFGTALTKKLCLKDKRIVIIGENTYHWYVSYMTMLCGAGIAVPVDKELPENEIENVIRRAKASAVIFSTKKSDAIKKIEEKEFDYE